MPKAVTDAAIIAAHERLKSGRAVARETGVHENTVYQVLRRARGVCPRCGGPPAPGKTSCLTCLEFDRDRIKRERAVRRRAGVCVQCGEERSRLSNMYCAAHRIAAADRDAAYGARQRALRGSPQGEAQNRRQKMRSLLERFGPNGRLRWDHAGGACEVCGTRYGETAIHVHHIDQNQENGAFDNLICLCFDCHTATHKLLRLRHRPALLDWFARTYPAAVDQAPARGLAMIAPVDCPAGLTV